MVNKKIGKARKTIGSVLIALCSLLILYFLAIAVYRFTVVSPEKRLSVFTRFLAEFGFTALISLAAFDVRFSLFSWKRNKLSYVLGVCSRVTVVAICAVFISLSAAIIISGNVKETTQVQTVCVLGLSIDGDKLPDDLVFRLEETLAYHASHPEVTFILSGGNSDDPERTEGAQMAKYLIEKGFDPAKLVVEDKAKTTVENFKNTANIVDASEPLGVITNDYHVFRANKIAKKQGFAKTVKIPAASTPFTYLENVEWETVCSIFETLRGNMTY